MALRTGLAALVVSLLIPTAPAAAEADAGAAQTAKPPERRAAQPGYDMATGLGSLKAAAFADAVASMPPPPVP